MNPFVELLQVSLGCRNSLSHNPSVTEWLYIYEESQRQAVAGILLGGLEKLPEGQRPSQVMLLQWIGLDQIIEQQNQRLNDAAKQLTLIFENRGLRSCVLKGQGLAKLYPEPKRRQSGDIDLWVEGGRERVLKFLKNNYLGIGKIVIHHVDTEIIHGVDTEIHFIPIWLYNPLYNKRLQKYFSANSEDQFINKDKQLGFSYPVKTFNAVYNLAHILHHLLDEGVGVRHVVDYYYVISQIKDEKMKSEVVNVIKHVGMFKFLSALMYVEKELCGASDNILLCESNDKEGRWLLTEIMAAGNFGHQRVGVEMHRNSLRRYLVTLKHYPSEVLFMIPWKIWHWCWRKVKGYI